MTFTGYVYKITGACGLVYIGSTIDMENRKYRHIGKNNSCSSKLLKKPLQFDIIDTREYKLVKTLHLVEQFYLDNNNTINQNRAYINERSLGYLKRRNQKLNQYYYNNKEENKEKSKAYYNKNKDKILQQAKGKIICQCGCLISRRNLSKHRKTKKHLKSINLLNS